MPIMTKATSPNQQTDAEQLYEASDQAIAVCDGDALEAVKALLVTNEFLEIGEKVSRGYLRDVKHGRFNTYSG
jgi:hypothetical protein